MSLRRIGAPDAGYSGTPLPKKLGVKPGAGVALVGAPAGFERRLGAESLGAVVSRRGRRPADLVVWFVPSRRHLDQDLPRVAARLAPGGGLWIAWPKKASGVATDVTESLVRRAGIAAGLVDYKVCAIDTIWSGLKFARRAALPRGA
jgi:hypothetical protein